MTLSARIEQHGRKLAEEYASALIGKCELQDELRKAHFKGHSAIAPLLVKALEAMSKAIAEMERVQSEINLCRKRFPDNGMSPTMEEYTIHPFREALNEIESALGGGGE